MADDVELVRQLLNTCENQATCSDCPMQTECHNIKYTPDEMVALAESISSEDSEVSDNG